VVGGLGEEDGDVRIVEGVDDPLALPLADYEAEVAQQAQLMRDRRLFHLDGRRQLPDRPWPLGQLGEDAHARRRSQGLHRLGDIGSRGGVEPAQVAVSLYCVAHVERIYEHTFMQ
jgi:hypothetical protein